jgi:hypothetical protein
MGFALSVVDRESFPVQLPIGYGPEADKQWKTWFTAPPERRGVWEISSADMGHLRQAMRNTGVLVNVVLPDWPDPFWVDVPGDVPTLTDEAMDFLEQGTDLPWCVPAFKFKSKDGWYVTPEECLVIARALRAVPDTRVHRFYRYCVLASRHWGFLVL